MQGWTRVKRALVRWRGDLLRPLAGDQAGEKFWGRHVRVGVSITETSAAVTAAYIVLADRPHRTLLLLTALLVMAASPLLLLVPTRIFSVGVRGPVIFYLWSAGVTGVVALVAFLDGGAESPLLWLLVLTMTFSALAYPPPGVVMMGGLMVAAYLTVVIVDHALSPATLLVATVLLSFTAMTAMVAHNHWDTYEQQLLWAARMAELDRSREEFVATTSHELRTPVASILGYVELLEDSPVSPDPNLANFLAKIRRNGERLQGLSEELLVLCAWDVEERSREVENRAPGEVDLVEIAGRVHETMAPLASRQQVALEFDLPPAPLLVHGAADQLERALLNLVSNAVKYTPAGGLVTCHVARESGDAVIEVRDTGIGIAKDELDALFRRFYRASSARERSIAGVGLGLSIVHEIITSLGGSVDVTSELGRGTVFVARLPRAVFPDFRGSSTSLPESLTNGTGKHTPSSAASA